MLIRFLTSKTFLLNLLLLAVIGITAFFLISGWLTRYTHHGQQIPVPDLRGKNIKNLEPILAPHNFHFSIVDSLYDGEKEPGSVLDQDPAPKSKVKENRTIYLTINSLNPPDVKMPDLVDVSYRQAEAILQSYGLITGEIEYRTDLAKNAVLEQQYKGKIIKPGTLVAKGSVIDLVLGDGLENPIMDIPVPDLTGLSYEEALTLLLRNSLSAGTVNFEGDADSSDAVIYRQYPPADEGHTLKAGQSVDLFLQ